MKFIVITVFVILGVVYPQSSGSAQTEVDVFAFCSPEFGPTFQADLNAMVDIGVTVMHGPCRQPPSDYSPLEPGVRYASVSEYRYLVISNAIRGVKTVVYDPRVWSESYSTRIEAIRYWKAYAYWIEAWDLGDEPNINHEQAGKADETIGFSVRWSNMRMVVHALGVEGLTNIPPVLGERYMRNVLDNMFPGTERIGFNIYKRKANLRWTKWFVENGYDPCPAIGTHGLFYSDPSQSAQQLTEVLDAGVTCVVLFPGAQVPANAPWAWNPLVSDGKITKWGEAIREVIA